MKEEVLEQRKLGRVRFRRVRWTLEPNTDDLIVDEEDAKPCEFSEYRSGRVVVTKRDEGAFSLTIDGEELCSVSLSMQRLGKVAQQLVDIVEVVKGKPTGGYTFSPIENTTSRGRGSVECPK